MKLNTKNLMKQVFDYSQQFVLTNKCIINK